MTTTISLESAEKARKLFSSPCHFVTSATDPKNLPQDTLPEIAFIGRSNVGKSSLINALTHRNGLARASNTPGRTQMINFFSLGNRVMLVDLPGYGHAKAPREEKDRWNELVQNYLRGRRNLKCTCLLIDGRHGLLANDLTMMQFLDRAAVIYQAVLTKIDHVHEKEREIRMHSVAAALASHPAARSEVLMTSSAKQEGLDSLQAFLVGLVDTPLLTR